MIMTTGLISLARNSGRAVIRRIDSRPDSEFQQALIRVVIALVFAFYFTNDQVLSGYPEYASQVAFWMWSFVAWSLALTFLVLMSKSISPVRRYAGIFSDTFITTYLMSVTGEAGAPLVFVYLWVTLGNGFRYGIRYLNVSATLSITGFGFIVLTSPFWGRHSGIAGGMLIMLAMIPAYTAFLLKKLYRAIEQANAANAAKSFFLANMSHELRTPLNGVIGIADLLRETPLNKEQQELTQVIHASAMALHRLIENVLDISRIEAGKLACINEDYDLHYLLNSLVMMLEPQAHRKGLLLSSHITPRTPYLLHGDAQHLRQVLINLIGNAIKFTEHGRVDVYVNAFTEHKQTWLRFEVADTGIGIPQEKQPHIFEIFTQADTSITRRYGGTGLGTSISKQLVEMMGGRIGLSSQPGKGTTFRFELPVQKQEWGPVPEYLPNRLRVGLLVSPEPEHRLNKMIHDWHGEASPLNAHTKTALQTFPEQAALTDVMVVERGLLDTDPVQFLSLLRDRPELGNLPVILVDHEPAEDQIYAWMNAGYSAVLRMPVNPTLLFSALHEAASHKDLPDNVVSLAEHYQAKAGRARLRILVAEDNPVNQRVMRGLLEHAGHEVVIASDGEEALSVLESAADNLSMAIIDMHMPNLSGLETVKRWRFMEKGHLPVIMLTADARSEAEQQCMDSGADAFLTKPVNSKALLNKVALLSQRIRAEGTKLAGNRSSTDIGALDESVLKELSEFGGGFEFVRDLVEEFRQDSDRALYATRQALTEQDYGTWKDQLHTLKGGASDVGAIAMSDICAAAERIKPFEIAQPLAAEHLSKVAAAQQATLLALEDFLARQRNALGL